VNTESIPALPTPTRPGKYTNLVSETSGTLKWIGGNSEYITVVTQTSSISGIPTTFTVPLVISVSWPSGADGEPTGGFDLIASPMVLSDVDFTGSQFCTFPRQRDLEIQPLSCSGLQRKITKLLRGYMVQAGVQIGTHIFTAEVVAWFAKLLVQICMAGVQLYDENWSKSLLALLILIGSFIQY